MTFANREQAEYWAERAPTWVASEDQLERLSGELGVVAMERLRLRPGELVVDLGCGTGRTTLELAAKVAPEGRAVGLDIAAAMLERARQHAAQMGCTNVEFNLADVQLYDFGGARFDAAYSRFGVMFYSDPVAAFSRVHQALALEGRLAFVCWQPITDNEWMHLPGRAAASIIGETPQMPGPGEPGPFSLSDPDRVRSILSSAGFNRIQVEALQDPVIVPEEQIPQVARLSTTVGAVRQMLAGADAATRDRVLVAIEDAMRSRLEGGHLPLSRGVWVVTATA